MIRQQSTPIATTNLLLTPIRQLLLDEWLLININQPLQLIIPIRLTHLLAILSPVLNPIIITFLNPYSLIQQPHHGWTLRSSVRAAPHRSSAMPRCSWALARSESSWWANLIAESRIDGWIDGWANHRLIMVELMVDKWWLWLISEWANSELVMVD